MAIQWVSNKRTHLRKRNYEIKIWRRKNESNDLMFISFWDDMAKTIDKDSNVMVGVDGNRLYFKLLNKPKTGTFKATNYSLDAKVVQIPLVYEPSLADFDGMYEDVNFDCGMYYVEREGE